MQRRGFTLLEVMIAVILVGLAVAALLGANIAFTRANGAGVDLTSAEFIIEQFRELGATLAAVDPVNGTSYWGPESGETLANYDDVDDFDGKIYKPPIAADRSSLANFAQYTEQITIENVSANNFEQVVSHHSSKFIRITVKVLLNNRLITSESWIRTRY